MILICVYLESKLLLWSFFTFPSDYCWHIQCLRSARYILLIPSNRFVPAYPDNCLFVRKKLSINWLINDSINQWQTGKVKYKLSTLYTLQWGLYAAGACGDAYRATISCVQTCCFECCKLSQWRLELHRNKILKARWARILFQTPQNSNVKFWQRKTHFYSNFGSEARNRKLDITGNNKDAQFNCKD